MPNVTLGNHSSVIVPRGDRENILKFYRDVLGGVVTQSREERDVVRLGDAFYIVLYGDVEDSSEFRRTARSVWLELKSDDVDALRRTILASGLVRQLDIPDAHLYFQAPGGQCWRLVGVDEDLSFYEGAAEGPGSSPETELTVEFHQEGGGTRLVLTQTGFLAEGGRDGHGEGWASALANLVTLFEEGAA